jgi:protocatechuate 3,4-dioxygenase beta subunit
MRYGKLGAVLLILVWPGICPAAEPVLGGPCEGCELVFEGMPAEMAAEARIAPVDEAGEPLVVEGIVRTADGVPVAGIVVYAYHTDATGIYPRSTTRHGGLRGWARTDVTGRYRFSTIRPGAYPTGGQPEHIHMHVIEPGKGTYYIDDIFFDDDDLLTEEHRKRLRGRGGSGLTHPTKDEAGVWRVRRDITLGLNIPGYY